jgi:UDP-glucose 4-epimerase
MNIVVTGGSGSGGKNIFGEVFSPGHTVGVLDLIKPKNPSAHFHRVDVLKLDDVLEAVKGYDAIVHCAGIPHPLNDPPKKVFDTNVNGTFNVLEAAAQNGIKKVVFTSSESTLGFAFMANRMVPEYIPIDEQHPLRPQDPYGLSKVAAEQICKTYSSRYGIRTVCLREPWIWVPEESMIPFYKKLVTEYNDWQKNLWAYVHVYDVAQAHRLALEKDLGQFHELFFITARENWTGKDSKELLSVHYPEVAVIDHTFAGASSIISHGKASRILGYTPMFSAHDLFKE